MVGVRMKFPRAMGGLWVVCALTPALAWAQGADFERYRAGQTALDNLQWQKALNSFQGLSSESAQADGALYWKAFALYKLGQGREALAGIDELRKSFPQSGWLQDAETLATAIGRNAGAKASPKNQPAWQERSPGGVRALCVGGQWPQEFHFGGPRDQSRERAADANRRRRNVRRITVSGS